MLPRATQKTAGSCRPQRRSVAALVLLTLCCLTTAGCYERVVRADGLGGSGKVEPSARSNTAVDRAWDRLWEPETKPNKGSSIHNRQGRRPPNTSKFD
ncbi:MAG: hypothetical protein KF859_06210 [Phycisphaeraceae bacterium]|nr:hypothetical protein [Phycisphaeraceae bacterium]